MYLIFDTETTGLPKNFDAPHTDLDNWPRLVQLAWQLHDNQGNLLAQENLIVKPEGFTIPFNAEKVHGISTEIALEEGHPLAEVLEKFAQDIEKADLLIGHNISFDLNIMGAEYLRADLESLLWDKQSYDTKSEESAAFVAIPGGKGGKFKWPTLTELHQKLFGEGFDDAHDAAYDVAATARSYFGLIENRIAPPYDDTPPENISYQAPELDEANFVKKRDRAGSKIPAQFRGTLDRFIPFNHLHVHSQFSILQSTTDAKALMKRVKELGMEAVGITDFGNMHVAFNAVAAGAKEEIKVIMGSEVYVAEERLKKQFTKNNPDRRFLQVLLAKNQEAYHRLARLVSLGYVEGYYDGLPRVDKQLIKEHSEGLVALTGHLQGEIPDLILNRGEHEAEEAFKWWVDVFGDDFYVELQRHGLPEEDRVNEVLLNLAAKYNVKPIATHSSFYINPEDFDAHDTLLCVKDGQKKDTPSEYNPWRKIRSSSRIRFGMPNEDFYFKTPEEMNDLFSDIPVALENVQEVIDKCEPIQLKRDILMPNFEMPPAFETQDDYLKHLTYIGAKKHYGEITSEIEERLERELKIIKDMGFPGYFLIVQDFINEARDRGVAVGPGRGSAAGSAVAYCIGITNIDPIQYDLLFERFLNPERISMPDIDIDFDDEGRQEVINYVVEKYGKNQVAQIITYGTMAAKSAIKDVARVLDLPLPESNAMAKLVPEKPGTKLKDAIAEVAELEQIRRGNENDPKTQVLRQALTLEGSVRNTGIHAAGVIIAPDDLTKYIPVCTSKDADLMVTQFDGRVVEDAGMLKMDFLGLKTLTIIKDALKLIKKNHGKDIDIDTIPLDDEKAFELYQNGDTIGTFQFESEGMQMYLKDLKPNNIEDLIAMNALYRPGPLQFIPNFIKRKHGKEKVEYPHELLEGILKNTFGIMVYQEQIMQTAQILGGYTLGGADLLRRAMGKKKIEEMDRQEVIFVKGAKENHNIPEAKAKEVFEIMKEFAKYGFNRSHSAAYSVVAYQTAYLKANYTPEYMASVLTHNMNSIEKITFFIEECKNQEVDVLGPDINESGAKFTVNKEGQIRFGLAAIKGTGEAAIAAIIEEREQKGAFANIFDFASRVNLRTVNKKSFESLAQAGAFDSFNIKRSQYFAAAIHENDVFIAKLLRYGNAVQEDAEKTKNSLFGEGGGAEIAKPNIPNAEPWDKLELLKKEKEVVGFYISGHPLDQFRGEIRKFCNMNAETASQLTGKKENICLAGIVTQKVVKTSRNGNEFTAFTIEDFTGSLNLTLFGNDHIEFSEMLEENEIILVRGKSQKSFRGEDSWDFRVEKIELLQDLKVNCKAVALTVPVQKIQNGFVEELEALIQEYAGEHELQFYLQDFEEKLQVELTSGNYRVQNDPKFIRRLEDLEVGFTLVYD